MRPAGAFNWHLGKIIAIVTQEHSLIFHRRSFIWNCLKDFPAYSVFLTRLYNLPEKIYCKIDPPKSDNYKYNQFCINLIKVLSRKKIYRLIISNIYVAVLKNLTETFMKGIKGVEIISTALINSVTMQIEMFNHWEQFQLSYSTECSRMKFWMLHMSMATEKISAYFCNNWLHL